MSDAKPLLPRAQWLQTLPRKRLAAAALLLYGPQFLIVKPTYKDNWLLPGGTIEPLENPLEGALREIREEIGLTATINRLLVVDYRQEEKALTEADDKIDFLFSGEITSADLAAIVLQAEELSAHKLITGVDVDDHLSPWQAARVKSGLIAQASGRTIYAHNGMPVLG